jgi:tetratricopeptide (TPR) repeat protein
MLPTTANIGLPTAVAAARLIERLRDDLVERRVRAGFECLDEHRDLIAALRPEMPGAAAFTGYLARWVDLGYGDPALIESLLARFPAGCRAGLPVRDYLHLRMAEGMLLMSQEEPDKAMRHLDFVISLGDEIDDRELLATSYFWKSRCHRKKGEYEEALVETNTAIEIADELGFSRFKAVMRVLESWLLFQRGRTREAIGILEDAGAALRETDDYITLGNIQSAYGRMMQREGRYEEAVRRFTDSIEEYARRDPHHRNLARALANMAYVKRLLALEVKKTIDSEAARRAGRPVAAYRARFQQLREEALAHLHQAGAIYAHHHQYHGAGTVKVNCGWFHLDSGEFDRAATLGAEAFRLGREKKDYILMARARLLECMVENAKFEEGVGGDPSGHARAAHEYARDAVEFAGHTENSRLLARAYVWQGLTLTNEFFNDPETARRAYDAAAALIKPGLHDPLFDDLQELRKKIMRDAGVDAVLEAWSHGAVGDKTFQQITEDFADLIIPKIWEQEGRKVSRVAARLSISPKKVRRILIRVGLLKR